MPVRRSSRPFRWLTAAVAASLFLAACPAPSGTGGPRPAASTPVRKAGGTGSAASPAPGGATGGSFVGPGTGAGLVTPTSPTPAIVQPPAGGDLISDQGGLLTGKVKAPAGVLSNNGAGVISNNGGGLVSNNGGGLVSNNGGSFVTGYRLAALDEQPVAGVLVRLVLANGDPVRDAAGQPIAATTGPDGSYTLPYAGAAAHAVVVATLPGGKGEVVGFVPRGERRTATSLDLDTTSTLAMGYVLARYVRRDPAILEKLPPEMEADTRVRVAAALAAAPPPGSFTPLEVVARVDALRRGDQALDGQLETVRRTLLAGLSDQGVGLPASGIEVAPTRALRSPLGELVWADQASGRVFRKDAAGKVAVVAGRGVLGSDGVVGGQLGGAAGVGDGGLATEAPLLPNAIAYALDGSLLIGDNRSSDVRRVDAAGRLSTFADMPATDFITDLEALPDGTLRVATPGGVYAVDAAGRATLIAGEAAPGLPLAAYASKTRAAGDGGPPAAARFNGIAGIGADPRSGDVLVYDFTGVIRRIGKDQVTRVAGDPAGAAGDGGAALAAKLAPSGDVLVDAAGRLYVAEGVENRIRMIGEDGTIRTVAGTGQPGVAGDGGPAVAAQLGVPAGLALGLDGEILISCDGLIRRLADGKLSTEAGALAISTAPRPVREVQFLQPDTVRFEPATGAVLIADQRHIWRWLPAADTMEIVTSRGVGGGAFAAGGSARDCYLNGFTSLQVEPDGALLYACLDPLGTRSSRVIRQTGDRLAPVMGDKVVPGSKPPLPALESSVPPLARVASVGGLTWVSGILPQPVVYKFAPGGPVQLAGGGGTAKVPGGRFADYGLSDAGVLEAGPDGQLYLSDGTCVLRIDPASGTVAAAAGRADGQPPAAGQLAADARFAAVSGLAWDAQGRLHVTDLLPGLVWRVEADGRLTLVAGKGSPNLSGAKVDEALGMPCGLAFDAAGDLYVADRGLHQVKRVPKAALP